MQYEEVVEYAYINASDYPSSELEQTAKSAFKNTEQFASKTPIIYQTEGAAVSSVSSVPKMMYEENEKNTENYISDEIYNYLPKDIEELCNTYDQPQRDFLLCSLLAVLGASCKGATGAYADKIQNTNLYSLIIAPAASGKGVMGVAEEIVEMLDSFLRDQSERLYLPANVSGAKLGQLLQANNEFGLIIESEADTINDVMAQDWSMLSPLLRKAFQGEKISSARKSEDFEVEVKDPHLSMAITCTPNQVEKLFKSPENGLYSRFLIYFNQEKYVYRSPKPSKHIDNRKLLIEEIGSSIVQTYKYCQEKKPIVYMNDEQWDDITTFFENKVEEFRSEDMSVLGGVISRTSLIAFRIMMALSVYKARKKDFQEIWVDAESFKASLKLIEHLISMNLQTIDLLSKTTRNNKSKNIESLVLNELPDTFTSKEYIKIGAKRGLSERSCYSQLKKLKSCQLIQPNGPKGNYLKLD